MVPGFSSTCRGGRGAVGVGVGAEGAAGSCTGPANGSSVVESSGATGSAGGGGGGGVGGAGLRGALGGPFSGAVSVCCGTLESSRL